MVPAAIDIDAGQAGAATKAKTRMRLATEVFMTKVNRHATVGIALLAVAAATRLA